MILAAIPLCWGEYCTPLTLTQCFPYLPMSQIDSFLRRVLAGKDDNPIASFAGRQDTILVRLFAPPITQFSAIILRVLRRAPSQSGIVNVNIFPGWLCHWL